MSGEKKLTDYCKFDNSVDFEEKRKVSSELTHTSDEVCSKIYFCNINCRNRVAVLRFSFNSNSKCTYLCNWSKILERILR
jgi:hypothetical protein